MSTGPYREANPTAPKKYSFLRRWWWDFEESVGRHIRKQGGWAFLCGLGISTVLVPVGACYSCNANHQEKCVQVCEANNAVFLDHTCVPGRNSCACLQGSETLVFGEDWRLLK